MLSGMKSSAISRRAPSRRERTTRRRALQALAVVGCVQLVAPARIRAQGEPVGRQAAAIRRVDAVASVMVIERCGRPIDFEAGSGLRARVDQEEVRGLTDIESTRDQPLSR